MCSKAGSRRATPPVRAVPDVTPNPGDGTSGGPAGGKGPNSFVPRPRFEYKAPSMFAEHRYLAILFVLVIIAGAVYLIRLPRKPIKIDPLPPPPVYIEPIPERPAADSHAGHS
jgi:hypothetical protein